MYISTATITNMHRGVLQQRGLNNVGQIRWTVKMLTVHYFPSIYHIYFYF